MKKLLLILFVIGLLVMADNRCMAGSVENPNPRVQFKTHTGESISVWVFMDRETNVICYVTDNSISCIPQGHVSMTPFNKQWKEFIEREGITDEKDTPSIFFLDPPLKYTTPSKIKEDEPAKDQKL